MKGDISKFEEVFIIQFSKIPIDSLSYNLILGVSLEACRRSICLLFHFVHFYGNFKEFYYNTVLLSQEYCLCFIASNKCLWYKDRFLNTADESQQSTYMLQPCSVKSDTVTPSFYFVLFL